MASATAVATATVAGTITYHDMTGVARPVRNALVSITADGGLSFLATARTSDVGAYSLSFTPADCTVAASYQVEVLTNDGVGKIVGPSGWKYHVLSGPVRPCPGDSLPGVNLDIPNTDDVGKAFALLDALYTVGSYYTSISQAGWDSTLTVHYPVSASSAYTDPRTHGIYIPGDSALCGNSPCPEEAFDWDMLARESGHVVAMNGGFNAPVSGTAPLCASSWSGSTAKSTAVGRAWNAGWATFYGLAALRDQGVPYGMPGVQNGVFNDTGLGSSYPLDDASPTTCATTPAGDTSELAVQQGLWEFADGDYDGYGGHVQWPLSQIMPVLESAKPTAFSAAYRALINEQSASIGLETYRTLSALGFAPNVTVTGGTGGAAPVIAWSRGGSTGHLNNSFTVRFVNDSSGTVISSAATTSTKYTPSASTWAKINGIWPVSVEVAGTQTTSPVSGPFTSSPVPVVTAGSGGGSAPPKILIIGDSISNGFEGSYTWRYRLWRHFAETNTPVLFVGHRTGTEYMYDNPSALAFINGTTPPPNPYDADPTDGSYLSDRFLVTGQSNHDTVWGWATLLAMNEVQAEVAAYQPDYLLVELGFNDLAYLSSPQQAIADMGTLIANARAANPDLKIVIADVVHRTDFPDLNAIITTYNNLLPAAIAGWSTAQSPVAQADISSGYDPYSDSYDGLHPNGVGDYVLAAGFETALHDAFGLGAAADPIPSSVPDPVMSAPTSISATAVPQGDLVSWGHTYGAGGYFLYSRDVTAGQQGFTGTALPIPGDHWYDRYVLAGHVYQYYVTAVRGTGPQSPASAIVTVTANPGTPAAPAQVTARPARGSGASRIAVSWSAVPGADDSYRVLWSDLSSRTPDVGAATVHGTSYAIGGLRYGDVYQIAVVAVNRYGSGYPAVALPVRLGYGAPTPAQLAAVPGRDPSRVLLSEGIGLPAIQPDPAP